jgi:hypothetical protein
LRCHCFLAALEPLSHCQQEEVTQKEEVTGAWKQHVRRLLQTCAPYLHLLLPEEGEKEEEEGEEEGEVCSNSSSSSSVSFVLYKPDW